MFSDTFTSLSLVLALALAGCGDDDRSSDSTDAPPAVDAAVATDTGAPALDESRLVLDVPADLSGTPSRLFVVASETVPPMGPPAAILMMDEDVDVSAGDALELDLDTSALSGDYFVIAILFMEGGGMFQPEAGVDYAAATESPHTFEGSPVDLGTLTLTLAE